MALGYPVISRTVGQEERMQTHADFFPRICFPDDLSKMTLAHRGVMAQIGCADLDPDEVAKIALRFSGWELSTRSDRLRRSGRLPVVWRVTCPG